MVIYISNIFAQSQWLGLGILTALGVLDGICRKRGLNTWKAIVLFAVLLGSAVIGGRLWAVLFTGAPLWGWAGFGSLGAIGMAGFVGAILWSGSERPMFRALVPASLILLGFVRLGCVFQGCDRGRPGSWGFIYEQGMSPHFPFPAFDASLALTAGMIGIWKHPFIAVGIYLVGRFFLEFGRDPNSTVVLAYLNRPQWGLLMAIAVLTFMWRRK